MKLSNQAALLLLSSEGVRVVDLADLPLPASGELVEVNIEEADDLGLWLRVPREGQIRLFLLRWEYIVGLELQDERKDVIGIRR